MKELIGKIAKIEAPALFDGVKELRGFEYTENGMQVRWRGQRNFVPVGLLSVHDTKNDPEAVEPEEEQEEAPKSRRTRKPEKPAETGEGEGAGEGGTEGGGE